MILEKMMACLWKLQLGFWTYGLICLLDPSSPNVVSRSQTPRSRIFLRFHDFTGFISWFLRKWGLDFGRPNWCQLQWKFRKKNQKMLFCCSKENHQSNISSIQYIWKVIYSAFQQSIDHFLITKLTKIITC